MPQSGSKANYKTFEAQARLLRAIVAAHPEVKWNYKEIVACYGSDMTEHALNHRFRRIRAQSVIIREGRQAGFDMKNMDVEGSLPATQEGIEKKNIAKYFGQSTPDGIQFQFRTIKKDAEKLRNTNGQANNDSFFSTPSKPIPVRGSGSRSGTGTGTGKRARTTPAIKQTSSDEDDSLVEIDNWSDHQDDTPSKRAKTGAKPGQRNGTPSRKAATKATATITDASLQLQSSESPQEVDTPASTGAPVTTSTAPLQSIFGNPSADVKVPVENNVADDAFDTSAFVNNGMDLFIGADVSHYKSYYDDVDDGEI